MDGRKRILLLGSTGFIGRHIPVQDYGFAKYITILITGGTGSAKTIYADCICVDGNGSRRLADKMNQIICR